jgi:hypothetical protein
LPDNSISDWYDEESRYAPYESIHPFCEVFFSIIRDEETYDWNEYENGCYYKDDNGETFENLNEDIAYTRSYVAASGSLMKFPCIIYTVESR